jgi:hypothetical protein
MVTCLSYDLFGFNEYAIQKTKSSKKLKRKKPVSERNGLLICDPKSSEDFKSSEG